jgi:hypothetical protein
LSNERKGSAVAPLPSQPLKSAVPAGANVATPGRPNHANKHDELRLLINSRHPIITAETAEEERFEALLVEVAAELAVPLYLWSVTTGLAKAPGAPMYNTDNPEQGLSNIALIQGDGIFWLKDFARYCENDKICRRLRDLAEKFRTVRRSIVITAASIELPPDLEAMPCRFSWVYRRRKSCYQVCRRCSRSSVRSNTLP